MPLMRSALSYHISIRFETVRIGNVQNVQKKPSWDMLLWSVWLSRRTAGQMGQAFQQGLPAGWKPWTPIAEIQLLSFYRSLQFFIRVRCIFLYKLQINSTILEPLDKTKNIISLNRISTNLMNIKDEDKILGFLNIIKRYNLDYLDIFNEKNKPYIFWWY